MNLNRYPNKSWFWGIAFSTIPRWAHAYTKKVLKNRQALKPHDFEEKKIIRVTDKWLEKLAKHDFVSKCTSIKKYVSFNIYLL